MYSITTIITLVATTFIAVSSASPVVRKSLNPKFLHARSPLTFDVDAEDWPTNVVFQGGSQTYGLWVPPDGSWYDLGYISCLGLPANAIGDCNDMVVNGIGVVANEGPCKFLGYSGYSSTIPGNPGDGFYAVGPPQNMKAAACGPT